MQTYILGRTVEFTDLEDLKAKVDAIHEELHYDWNVILGTVTEILSVEILNKISQMRVGEEFTIALQTSPSGLPLNKFEVSVTPAELGSLTGNKLLAEATGDLVLKIEVDGNPDVSDTMTVKVLAAAVPVASIDATDISGVVGDTGTLSTTVLPADATDKSVTIVSKDATVATINDAGAWELKKVGSTTADITSVSTPSVKKTINITVAKAPVPVTSITADNISGEVGATGTINFAVLPADADNKAVKFTSKDTAKVTVNADTGAYEFKAAGSTTIDIVSVENGSIKKTITVTITAASGG